MRKLYIIALAVVLLGIAPLFAASDDAAVSAVPRPFVATAATTPGIIANSITIGKQDTGALPCFACVNGATIANLGLAVPLSSVPEGASLTVVVTADDVDYSGPCTFSYAIRVTTTSKPILTGSLPPADCYPAIWYAYFPITVPPASGSYILEGAVLGAKTSQINASLTIE